MPKLSKTVDDFGFFVILCNQQMDTLSHIKYQKDEGRRNDIESSNNNVIIFIVCHVMFVWEKIPLGVTSMIICVGLVVTGVLDWKTAFAGLSTAMSFVRGNVYCRGSIV